MSESDRSINLGQAYPHRRSTRLVEGCAKAFNAKVEDPDIRRWSGAITLAKALDTLVDDDHVYDSGIYMDRLLTDGTLPYATPAESEFMRDAYYSLSEASQERWRNSGTQLGSFAIRRLEAKTVDDYAAIVLEESYLMSDMLLIENDETRQDHRERDDFNTWVRQLARTAFICDTISDFIRDYNEDNVSIRPAPKAAVTLGRYALKELAAFTRITPMPVYVALARRSATKVAEKIRQPGFLSRQFHRKVIEGK